MVDVAKTVKETLDRIDERSKSTQDYVLRTLAKAPLKVGE